MKVLLVFPGLDFEVAYPLGLAAVAGALLAAGHEVVGVDVALDGLVALDNALKKVVPDVVGIAIWTPGFTQAAACVRRVRAAGTARLLLGGPHASLQPERTLLDLGADAVVVGDGEAVAVEILDAWARGQPPVDIAGCVWRSGQIAVVEQPRKPVNVDVLGCPDRTVFDPRRYPHAWARAAPHATPVVTSRGCPRSCAHCPSPVLSGGRWRARSVHAVVDEMRGLPDYVGHVLIEDEHPTVDRRRWLALCRAIEDAQLGRTWSCPNGLRAETLDGEVVQAMAAAGCTGVALGVESADDEMLKRLGRCSLDEVFAAAAACRDVGIEVTAYFVLGLPGARRRAPLQQLRAARRMGASGAHFSLYAPLPGAAWGDAPAAPARLGWVRSALYLGFYGDPRVLVQALRAGHAGLADVPAAVAQLRAWLSYGGRPRAGSPT